MQLATSSPTIRYELYHGAIPEEQMRQLIPLRLELFHDYPYLYCGSPEREERQWKSLPADSTVLVTAYDGAYLVGALLAYAEDTAKHVALVHYPAYRPGHGMHVDLIMVVKTHRRYGITRELFKRFEEDVQARGYTDLYGITVMRSQNHPLKPVGTVELDALAPRVGFHATGLYEIWNWPTRVGTAEDESAMPIDNAVQYWHKRLN